MMMLTPEELAKRWRLNSKTLSNWRVSGKGPRFVKLGAGRNTKVLYREDDVRDYEEKHMRGRT